MTCCQQRAEAVFDEKVAKRDLKRYRKKGLRKPTRLLVDAIKADGLEGRTALDIGGGVGAIQHEVLSAGAAGATSVETSAAYLQANREESARQGHGDRVAYHHGDFVELAPALPAADVVTLDRVVCCYPEMERLVGLSAAKARRLYGLVYPRDTRLVRFGFRIVNLMLRLRRREFRAFVHRPAAIDRAARDRGLELDLLRDGNLVWAVALYRRTRA
jgi:magnesium-protoporphyrin O-methyltransferase